MLGHELYPCFYGNYLSNWLVSNIISKHFWHKSQSFCGWKYLISSNMRNPNQQLNPWMKLSIISMSIHFFPNQLITFRRFSTFSSLVFMSTLVRTWWLWSQLYSSVLSSSIFVPYFISLPKLMDGRKENREQKRSRLRYPYDSHVCYLMFQSI